LLMYLDPLYMCVSIHAPARGATSITATTGTNGTVVSIHAPARGATANAHTMARAYVFQSTPPRGGRPYNLYFRQPTSRFQSTPPRGGRRGKSVSATRSSWFQSTPPRGGRHEREAEEAANMAVSIHAPARGATYRTPTWRYGLICFNPRPRAGGDSIIVPPLNLQLLFQSTPPRGGRQAKR